DDAALGDGRVADELLVAGEDVAAVDPPRVRLDRGRVRPGAGLGDRDGRGRWFQGTERRQPAPPLLVAPEREHRPREEPALRDHERDRAVAPGQLLDHEAALVEALDAAPAVLARQVVAGEAELGATVEELPRVLLGLVV